MTSKTEITFEKAIKNKLSMIDVCKHYFPAWSNEKCDMVVWEKTCFPLSTVTALIQLYQLYLNTDQLATQDVVVPKHTLPYNPKCDDACKFYCTKGNTQHPKCLK